LTDRGGVSTSSTLDGWLSYLARASPALGEWLSRSPAEQKRLGYARTLRLILEQPYAWEKTAQDVAGLRGRLRIFLSDAGLSAGQLLLTGSGSGAFIGQCLERELMVKLGIPVRAVASESLVTDVQASVPPLDPPVVVAFSRSRMDMEIRSALDRVKGARPASHHVVFSCCASGEPARTTTVDQQLLCVHLHQHLSETALPMTGAFTNLVLAGAFLGMLGTPEEYTSLSICEATVARSVLDRSSEVLARVARGGFRTAVFLGGGDRLGAAREAALKMVVMTSGRVQAFADSPFALRHGLMDALDEGVLLVVFVSPTSPAREVELELLRDLDRHGRARSRVIVGEAIPVELKQEPAVVIDRAGVGSQAPPLVEVLTGQLLAVFRCLYEGGRPDALAPSGGGSSGGGASPTV
jgi:tagatose-6-phosphate ketose/aldose isomerase